MGIKPLPHFENLLHTFAMQYKISVQGNCETVCLLSKLHEAKHHVNVRLDMDELDLTSAESKATYEEIKAYVAEHNDGMKVSNLYIAQVKACLLYTSTNSVAGLHFLIMTNPSMLDREKMCIRDRSDGDESR